MPAIARPILSGFFIGFQKDRFKRIKVKGLWSLSTELTCIIVQICYYIYIKLITNTSENIMPQQSAVNLLVSDLRRDRKKSMGELLISIVEIVGADEWRAWVVNDTDNAPVPFTTDEQRVAFYLDNKAEYDKSIKESTAIYGQNDLSWYRGSVYRKDSNLIYNDDILIDVFVNHNVSNPMFNPLASQFVLNNLEGLGKAFIRYLAHK